MTLALIIFVGAYLLIASEKVNKSLVAMFTAGLMVMLKILPEQKAFGHIDLNVIILLISMMMIVKIIEKTGLFEYLAIFFAKRVKGEPKQIMIAIFLMTCILSAFLDNITTVMLLAPVSILIATELEVNPIAFLIPEIIGSNIGGTATLIGDPPNIMIGSATRLNFMDFIYNLAPIIFLQMLIFPFIFLFIFRKDLVTSNTHRARISDFNEKDLIKNKKLLKKSLIVLGFILSGFVLHGILEVEAAIVAVVGASVLIFISKVSLEEILEKTDWQTIFFFSGLFVMVGALIETGFIELLSNKMLTFTKGDVKLTAEITLWFSGIFSGIVDNIPFVATMIPVFKHQSLILGNEAIRPLWWSLALGACLGGNATIIGASANIIVVSFAKKAGHKISFLGYLKYGLPLTFISLFISYIYLMVRYF